MAPVSPASAATRSSISCRKAGPSAAKGSSNSTSGLFCTRTRASAARLCCPPDKAPGRRASNPARPTRRMAAATCALSSALSLRLGRKPRLTFCATLRCGNRLLS
ncbi:conserved hypothetical protein [Roseobacter denitrificans OCh 114]|uniref:Uncharacterized protein n=1 Tax=Roseobacter denitrificans (strain ATCC 33942 / OCh 114) TaxID=375451 RepID=Q16CM9_ROSDO|nr:conserved hypothetical protein [Roseobacter denitrificans OCh 114]